MKLTVILFIVVHATSSNIYSSKYSPNLSREVFRKKSRNLWQHFKLPDVSLFPVVIQCTYKVKTYYIQCTCTYKNILYSIHKNPFVWKRGLTKRKYFIYMCSKYIVLNYEKHYVICCYFFNITSYSTSVEGIRNLHFDFLLEFGVKKEAKQNIQ